MAVLIAFATIEGQTGKIARFVEAEVQRRGMEAVLADVSDETVDIDFEGVDKVVLAAPVHERRHPRDFEAFVSGQLEALGARKTLLLSVSLNAAFEEGREEAGEYLVEMKMRTGLEPDAEALVAGAVRVESYDFYSDQVVRHVILRDHDYNVTEGSREFTDWEALSKVLEGFL
ncbi:MAG: flavodoxin domain-containing protein [Paracoccaceae bacterium]|nr:flavodoxin domain-containing protein [Paracoccaceae bacterium]